MKMWTIQPVSVINDINEKGVFRCIPELAPDIADGSYVRPYNWLVKQMKKEIGDSPEGVQYPIWAWFLVDKHNKKPDMRLAGFRCYSPSVLIELEIPDDRVLLTDFDMWHCVLNNGPMYNANYDAKTEEEFDRISDDPGPKRFHERVGERYNRRIQQHAEKAAGNGR